MSEGSTSDDDDGLMKVTMVKSVCCDREEAE